MKLKELLIAIHNDEAGATATEYIDRHMSNDAIGHLAALVETANRLLKVGPG